MQKFDPTEEQRRFVEIMAASGIGQDVMCRVIRNPETGKPIGDATLRRHFKAELADGGQRMVAEVARGLFQEALKGNVTAMIFILKCRAGWRERSEMTVTGRMDGTLKEVEAAAARRDFVAWLASLNDNGLGAKDGSAT